ncbi:MAG TPA: response regulator [Blastocatellia bacterium]|nr:response regulator [Blastocatellia bacterium]
MSEKTSVLIVDDEISVADALEMILGDNGYDVTVALTGREALSKIDAQQFDITITDLRLPDISGLDILSRIREKGSSCLVIVITAHKTPEVVLESKCRGAYEVLSKPFFPSDVLKLISSGLNRQIRSGTDNAGRE